MAKTKTATVPVPPAEAKGNGKSGKNSWSGTLTFGVVNFPVVLQTGAREEKFERHTYHTKCKGPIKQLGNYCPQCSGAPEKVDLNPKKPLGEVQLSEIDMFKGVDYAGKIITVNDADIASMKPESAKVMEIMEFVKVNQVNPIYFESSYYLLPDVKGGGQRAFSILRKAMIEKGVVAIAKIVMQKRENLAIIQPYGDGMVLFTAYMPDEIRQTIFPELPQTNPKEVEIAGQLIDALTNEWEPSQYRDTYRENMNKLVAARAAGEKVQEVKKPAARAATEDVMAAFMATLEMAKQKAKRKTA